MEGRLRRLHLFPLFAVAVAIFYYGRFLDNFFNFDDFKYLENMYQSWVDVVIGYGSLRVVSNLSWWPLFAISGVDPFAYNLFALIIFTGNGILLYFLLVQLLADRVTAFLAAAFFVAGSAGVDAVFWKATNSSLISLFFYLSTLICYVEYRRTGERKQYIRAMVLFVLAMFSKEEAASLPFVAALIDIVFFGGWQDKRSLFRRTIPFAVVIVFYLLANAVVFNFLLGVQAAPQTLFRLRPLYSLIGGATAFFLAPAGFIKLDSTPVYLTALFVALSFLLKRSRKLLLFGYFWIFLTFLPQSLTGLGQFEPRVMVNSISRYLYITSIGVSVVFAAVLAGVRQWIPGRLWYGLAGIMLSLFIWVHYPEVKDRGEEWRSNGADVRDFLTEMKKGMPTLPSPSYIYVDHRPTGFAFLQQSLRAFYQNPSIFILTDPDMTKIKKGVSLFYVDCWRSPDIRVRIEPVK